MKTLFESSFAQLVAETLLHSIWQGALLTVIVFFLFKWIKAKNATARYAIGIGALVSLIIINVISFVLLLPNTNVSGDISTNQTNGLPILETMGSLSSSLLPIEQSSYLLSYFMIFWVSGLMFLSIRLTLKFYHAQSLKLRGIASPPIILEEALERLVTNLKINRPVRIMESVAVITPSVIGHFKPLILFPVGLANGLTMEQVESIIIHELAHIKRNDYLINLLQSFVEVVYFFNPFVWLISSISRQERENICDDIALASGVSSLAYASTLAELFQRKYYQSNLSLSFSKNSKLTLKRIRRIMKKESNNNNKVLLPLVMVSVIIASIYFGAKSPAGAVYEAASGELDVVIGASVLPEFAFEPRTSTVVQQAQVQNSKPQQGYSEPTHPQDTIDREGFKRKLKEYEKSIERLHGSQEWQEMEELQKAVLEQQELLMKEILPEIEQAMELARKNVEPSEAEILELKKRVKEVQDQMIELQISEELESALELKAEALEKVMMKMDAKIDMLDIEKLEKLAQRQAEAAIEMEVEARKMAEMADQMASEALEKADKVTQFIDELKPLLVKDGYLKKGDSIEELHFEDGKVRVNDKEVKSSDAKKYYKLREKYFDNEESFYIN
jgi:bla regulator protein BlaR1